MPPVAGVVFIAIMPAPPVTPLPVPAELAGLVLVPVVPAIVVAGGAADVPAMCEAL